jgi:hypothetical protein
MMNRQSRSRFKNEYRIFAVQELCVNVAPCNVNGPKSCIQLPRPQGVLRREIFSERRGSYCKLSVLL